jgi:hypothetical protein
MFIRYITRVRRAAPAVRTRHAFLWAVAVTGTAGVLWAWSLSSVLSPLPDSAATATTHDLPRPWASFFQRAKEQIAGVSGAAQAPVPDDTVPLGKAPNSPAGALELSPEALAEARARAAIEYVPPAVTTPSSTATSTTPMSQPRVVRIATTSSAVASTTTSPGR